MCLLARTFNLVSEGLVPLISSKSRVCLLKDHGPVGLSMSRSVELSNWTADWSNGIRYHVFDTRSDTKFKPFVPDAT